MQGLLIPVAALSLAFLLGSSCSGDRETDEHGGRTYYVSLEGDDSNAGTLAEEPWQTIQKVNGQQFGPGDSILFRGGDTFMGTLILSSEDSGKPPARMTITSYGDGMAIIDGMGREGLRADSCTWLTIAHLEFRGSGRNSGNSSDGLLISHCGGVVIDDIDVHGFQHSGVHVHRCNDAALTRVYAHGNGFAGIHVTGDTFDDPAGYDNHNLYIGYCVAENNPGDPSVLNNHSGNGILASSVHGGTIEYCEAFNNGWDMPWTGNGPVGIWIWDCTEFVIQYCISHHNRTNPVAADGGGFDLDGGVSNSVIQYCVSYQNEGAGYGLYEFGAAKPWENNTLRYNISQDDGIRNAASVGIWKNEDSGIMHGCLIYNNTFYNSLEDGSCLWLYDHYPGYGFYNNVFVYNGTLVSGDKPFRDEFFLGNLYWNLAGGERFMGYANLEEWAEATGNEMQAGRFMGTCRDPLFSRAGSLEVTGPGKITPESLAAYLPRPGSPLVDGGLNLKELFSIDPGGQDMLGTALPSGNNYDIGAIELKRP